MKFTKEDRKWSELIKKRDEHQCVVCGQDHHLNVHHLIPRENKELKHHLSNGITLCPSHHRFSRTLSAHQNPIAFQMWMEQNRPKQLQWIKDQIPQKDLKYN